MQGSHTQSNGSWDFAKQARHQGVQTPSGIGNSVPLLGAYGSHPYDYCPKCMPANHAHPGNQRVQQHLKDPRAHAYPAGTACAAAGVIPQLATRASPPTPGPPSTAPGVCLLVVHSQDVSGLSNCTSQSCAYAEQSVYLPGMGSLCRPWCQSPTGHPGRCPSPCCPRYMPATYAHVCDIAARNAISTKAHLVREACAAAGAISQLATLAAAPGVHLTTACEQRSMPRTNSNLRIARTTQRTGTTNLQPVEVELPVVAMIWALRLLCLAECT
jgi:hypothetical protein